MTTSQRTWSGKTGGTQWQLRALIVIFRYVDVRVMYAVMSVYLPFYMIFRPKAFASIFSYFRKSFGKNFLQAFCLTFCNYFRFEQVILDRFALYAGRKFFFKIHDEEINKFYVSKEDGLFVIASHIGNYEIAGYSFKMPTEKKIHVPIFSNEVETVMQNRQKIFTKNQISLIPIKEDLSHIFLLNQALSNGDIVSMHGDRRLSSQQKCVKCEFFARKADFPLGPFQLAASSGKNIRTMFVMKEAWNKYSIFSSQLVVNQEINRKERAADLAQQYAKDLEKIVKKYPTQWFNYFDFWK